MPSYILTYPSTYFFPSSPTLLSCYFIFLLNSNLPCYTSSSISYFPSSPSFLSLPYLFYYFPFHSIFFLSYSAALFFHRLAHLITILPFLSCSSLSFLSPLLPNLHAHQNNQQHVFHNVLELFCSTRRLLLSLSPSLIFSDSSLEKISQFSLLVLLSCSSFSQFLPLPALPLVSSPAAHQKSLDYFVRKIKSPLRHLLFYRI